MGTANLLPGNTNQRNTTKGSLLLNMFYDNGALQVRPGFGTLFGNETQGTLLGTYSYLNGYGAEVNVTVYNSGDRYSVVIFNMTTNEVRVETVYAHTSSVQGNLYSTFGAMYSSTDNTTAVLISPSNTEWYFCEYEGNLILGSESAGVFLLRSICTPGVVESNSQFNRTNQPGYADSTVLVPVVFTDGLYVDNYAYKQQLPPVVSACVINGRVCYATRNELYFSDVGYPNCVMSNNFIGVGNVLIKAIRTLGQSVAIFCEADIYRYVPSINDALASVGNLVVAYTSIGVSSKNALLKIEDSIAFINNKSAYIMSPGFTVSDIGQDIAAFFTTQLSNPISTYTTSQGELLSPAPNTWWAFSNESGYITVAYNDVYKYIIYTMPSQKMSLVYSLVNKGWAVWSYVSTLTAESNTNISMPLISSINNRVILAGEGYLLELGRGGGVDRNLRWENNPVPQGNWANTPSSESDGYVILQKPIKLQEGYVFPSTTVTANADSYLIPVYFQAPSNVSLSGIRQIFFTIDFDNTLYTPVIKQPSGTECAIIYPSQRLTAIDGWTWQMVGNQIFVEFDGTVPTNPNYTESPWIECVRGGTGLLGYLPIRALTDDDTDSMGLSVSDVSFTDTGTTGTKEAGSLVWNQEFFGSGGNILHRDYSQPVEWCVLSDTLADAQFNISKISIKYTSAGEAGGDGTSPTPSDVKRLINGYVMVDGRAFNAQEIDFNRVRIPAISNSGPFASQTLRYNGTDTASYGQMTYDSGYLLSDITAQMTTKGSRARAQTGAQILLYGWIKDKADYLVIHNIVVDYTPSPGRIRNR